MTKCLWAKCRNPRVAKDAFCVKHRAQIKLAKKYDSLGRGVIKLGDALYIANTKAGKSRLHWEAPDDGNDWTTVNGTRVDI